MPTSFDPWINAMESPSALSGLHATTWNSPKNTASDPTRLMCAPGTACGGSGVSTTSGTRTTAATNTATPLPTTTPSGNDGTVVVSISTDPTITPEVAVATPPPFAEEGMIFASLPDGTDLNQINSADVIIGANSGIETVNTPCPAGTHQGPNGQCQADADAPPPQNQTQNQQPKKKITKNLTPYAIGIGLIVVFIITIKVLNNDKK